MIGDIMSISRLRMGTDGKGVSTLVAFFGCPLHCKYCINDFCHKKKGCDESVPRGAYTPEQLIKILRKDELYYRMSGGGVTFGGGEPLLQSLFIHEVCKLVDPAWQIRIETSLNVSWECIVPIIEDIDEWIIDIKDMDAEIYQKYTGVSIKNLTDNLLQLAELVEPAKFHIRVPRIQGINTEKDVEKSVEYIRGILGVEPEVFEVRVPFLLRE